MYKMVVFDIDGTLIKHGEHVPSKKVINGIKKLKEKNIVVVIASGRDDISIGNVWNELQTDYFIGANGSFCNKKENGKIIRIINHPIRIDHFLEYKNEILDNEKYKSRISNIILSDTNSIFVKNKLILKNHWFWKGYDLFYKDLENAKKEIDENGFSLITINSTCEELKAETRNFLKQKNSSLDLQACWLNGFFISNIGINKAKTILELAENLGISKEKIIAFGDGENDIEMLQEVGLGVAMFNASVNVKEAAKKITNKPVENDGAIFFLEEIGIL